MMSRVMKGVFIGLVATIGVSLIEILNMYMGWFEPLQTIIAAAVGMPGNQIVGWAIHLVTGIFILGPLFVYVYPRLPTETPATKGIAFSVAICAIVIGVLIMSGRFTTGGFGTMAWMLISNAIFGIILGNVYNSITTREKRRAKAAFVAGAAA